MQAQGVAFLLNNLLTHLQVALILRHNFKAMMRKTLHELIQCKVHSAIVNTRMLAEQPRNTQLQLHFRKAAIQTLIGF